MSSSSPPSQLPKSPYGSFQGTLFQYHRNLVSFESNTSAPLKCILLGGLSDGMIPTPYCKGLEEKCHELGQWSLVQPILSSSYLGFGNGDLDRDVQELNFLLEYLKTHNSGTHFALVGHSTGCQISMHYLKHGLHRNLISLVVLQAPASDREGAMMDSISKYETNLAIANDLCQQKKENEMMPRSAFWAPITAKRFVDLQSVGGMDDYFSSDFTDLQLKETLGYVSSDEELNKLQAVLVAYSGADEYVPTDRIDTRQLTQRLVNAMGTLAIPLYLPTANHNLSQGESDLFLEKVGELLQKIE